MDGAHYPHESQHLIYLSNLVEIISTDVINEHIRVFDVLVQGRIGISINTPLGAAPERAVGHVQRHR